MVFTTRDGYIEAGGFLVKKPQNPPISILPDGLAVPAGLYTMHRMGSTSDLTLEPSHEVIEHSICDYLLSQLDEAKARKRETKRRTRKRSKKKTRSIQQLDG